MTTKVLQSWYAAGTETHIWLFPTSVEARNKARLIASSKTAKKNATADDYYLGQVLSENFPIIEQTKTIIFPYI